MSDSDHKSSRNLWGSGAAPAPAPAPAHPAPTVSSVSQPASGGAGSLRPSNGMDLKTMVIAGVAGAALGLGYFMANRYHVAGPSSYVVRTGLGIADIDIRKKAFQWPLQEVFSMELAPQNHSFILGAMSKEKLSFELPVTFTVGPEDEPASLIRYSRFLLGQEPSHQNALVKGVIEGETRILAAGLSIEEIFQDRVKFKDVIVTCVDEELRKFGLKVYTANVKDLQDTHGSEYFQYLRRRAVETAENQAKIDVSEARMKGDIGEKMRVGQTRMEIARIEAETVRQENERRAGIAESAAELRVKQAEAEQKAKMAEIQSKQATSLREAELETTLQQKNAIVETERQRVKTLTLANVEAEAQVRRATGDAETAMKAADAELYKSKAEAEAHLFRQLKEAEGIRAAYEAEAAGLERVRQSIGGGSDSLLQYLMIDRKVYGELAARNAEAIQGLAPKITVWSTGSGGEGGDTSAAKTLASVYKMLPPLASTVAEQTGIKPPSWLLTMPEAPAAGAESGGAASAAAAEAKKAASLVPAGTKTATPKLS